MKTKRVKQCEVSVLMAVYKNDRPDWLHLAIDSMLNQTLCPDEFIVVVDGPVSQQLRQVLLSYQKQLTVIWLKRNRGLWNALNKGLKVAKNELIARMDADDIATSDRIEKQVAQFMADPALDLVGGQIAEFEDNIENIVSYRRVPLLQQDIAKFARFRSPFNHPTIICWWLSQFASY